MFCDCPFYFAFYFCMSAVFSSDECLLMVEKICVCTWLVDSWMQDYRKSQEPFVDKLKEPVLDEITSALVERYKLNFTRQDTSSLWFLCKQVSYSLLIRSGNFFICWLIRYNLVISDLVQDYRKISLLLLLLFFFL